MKRTWVPKENTRVPEKVVNIGARDYLIKPIYADILLEKIHAVFYPTVGEVDPMF
jgi:DNA-binding response OmpR family regulator